MSNLTDRNNIWANLTTRHWIFIALALSTVLIAFTKLIPELNSQSSGYRYYYPVRWWLLPHVFTGAVALFAGPLQFSNRLRRSRPKLHRVVGFCYMFAVFLSAPFAAVVTLLHVALIPSLAPFVQGSAWIIATGMAWTMAVRRNFTQHRQWMIRSYALTTTFVSTRLLFSVPAIDRLNAEGSAIIILCTVALTMVSAEVGIQLHASGSWKAVRTKAQIRNSDVLESVSEKRSFMANDPKAATGELVRGSFEIRTEQR